jgi:hypothetical protein
MSFHRVSIDLAAAWRSSGLSLEKACSIELPRPVGVGVYDALAENLVVGIAPHKLVKFELQSIGPVERRNAGHLRKSL